MILISHVAIVRSIPTILDPMRVVCEMMMYHAYPAM